MKFLGVPFFVCLLMSVAVATLCLRMFAVEFGTSGMPGFHRLFLFESTCMYVVVANNR